LQQKLSSNTALTVVGIMAYYTPLFSFPATDKVTIIPLYEDKMIRAFFIAKV
jgi:hypothetical protein